MNNSDELYGALKSIGLSDEYIEFINHNINDMSFAGNIISEILSGKISDTVSFVEYFNKNFKVIPNINLLMQKNINQTSSAITATGIVNGISVYSKIADTISYADKVVSETLKLNNIQGGNGDNVMVSSSNYYKANQTETTENSETTENITVNEENNSVEDTENNSINDTSVQDNIQEDVQNEEKKIPLSNSEVTQHTAGLWKYQPVIDEEPENSEEYATQKLVLPDAEIIASSVRGKKHKHDGSNRDDSFCIASVEDIAVIAVSDGAGSKKFSRIGADISCKTAVSTAVELLEKLKNSDKYNSYIKDISSSLGSAEFMQGCGVFADIIQDSVISACKAVENAFEERKSKYDYLKVIKRDMELKDFSATLLLTMIIPVTADNKKQLFIVSCQIGDGMSASVSADMSFTEAVKLLGEADSGSFAGETDFITSQSMKNKEKLMGRTKVARREISDILVMTDGVADDYYPNSSRLAELYTDLQLNGIVSIKNFFVNNSVDDEIINKIPEPVSYPWVNDNSIEIPVNYSSKIAESCGITQELLWESGNIISSALKKLPQENICAEEKLKIWLDNYVERGSFDDRTLVIYSVKNYKEVSDDEQTG